MNILIVSQHFWPEDFRINDLSRDFIEKGHNVSVLTGTPNYPEGKIFQDFKKNKKAYSSYHSIQINRLPVIPRGSNKFSLVLNYISFVITGLFLSPFILRKQSFDLIFVFEPSPISVCIPAIFLKYLKNSKLCLWVLDLWPQSLYAVGYVKKNSYLIYLVRILVRYIYSKCNIILGTSNSFVQEIRKDCKHDQVVKFFPNWYESLYENSELEPAPEIKQDANHFNIMFAGNLGDAQDLPTIINGMNLIKDNKHIKLYLIGDGKRVSWINDAIKKNNLQESIFLLGRFPVERMPEFFYHADAMLVSLKPHEVYDQTIPGKLQSYLISKKTILGLLGGEGADIINNCNCGILANPGSPESFAKSALHISNMSSCELKKFENNGYEYAKTNFNKTTLFNQLNEWLIEIIK
jgi:colanic acid biosynthesis glycosyl transferase WcaI